MLRLPPEAGLPRFEEARSGVVLPLLKAANKPLCVVRVQRRVLARSLSVRSNGLGQSRGKGFGRSRSLLHSQQGLSLPGRPKRMSLQPALPSERRQRTASQVAQTAMTEDKREGTNRARTTDSSNCCAHTTAGSMKSTASSPLIGDGRSRYDRADGSAHPIPSGRHLPTRGRRGGDLPCPR